jgi:hypothetical protein
MTVLVMGYLQINVEFKTIRWWYSLHKPSFDTVYMILLRVPVLNWISLIHKLEKYFRSIMFNIIYE